MPPFPAGAYAACAKLGPPYLLYQSILYLLLRLYSVRLSRKNLRAGTPYGLQQQAVALPLPSTISPVRLLSAAHKVLGWRRRFGAGGPNALAAKTLASLLRKFWQRQPSPYATRMADQRRAVMPLLICAAAYALEA